MSEKEYKRRKIARAVMYTAWKTFRRCMISWSTCLRICWGTVRFKIHVYHTKVRGTSFDNRQNLLRRLALYPANNISIYFQRDYNNKFDTNAIMVVAKVKNKGAAVVGYLAKELASKIAPILDTGYSVLTMLDCISGTDIPNGYLGLNLSYIFI